MNGGALDDEGLRAYRSGDDGEKEKDREDTTGPGNDWDSADEGERDKDREQTTGPGNDWDSSDD